MTLTLPDGWVVLSPQDGAFQTGAGGEMKFVHDESPASDVFICASPDFRRYEIGGSGTGILLYSLPLADLEPIVQDFESVVSICEKWFGEPTASEAIVAIISPRRGGAEWGYKRGEMWVAGDGFANYLLDNGWVAQGLMKSLAAHETIHTWFGVSVGFEDASLR